MPSTAFQGATSTNVFEQALQWGGWQWTDGATPGTNITYYFQPSGQSLSSVGLSATTAAWSSAEEAAYRLALDAWAAVADLSFTEVFSYGEADLVENIYEGSGSLLGLHETPEWAASGDFTAWGAYNRNGYGWTANGLEPGGYGFVTIVHELGHALGLAHPHDDGGGSGTFPGVTLNNSSDLGDNQLNQGIFTVMSYIDGWPTQLGYSPSQGYGWQSGPMAFDIAAIQDLYGANDDYHAGNDVYVLRHVNGRPDTLTAIWDTGGVDTIVYGGRYAATIDLRAATLENEPGGGGFVSYARGAPSSHLDHWNAFTIANGVVIENAKGGFSHDRIIGNQADNKLFGLAGTDLLIGVLGDDLLHGGGGWDRLIGGSGDDLLRGAGGRDRLIGGNGDDIFDFNAISHSRPRAPDVITQFDRGMDLIDLSNIDARSGIAGNNKFKWIGKQDFHEKRGELHYKDLGSKVLVEGDINGDGRADFALKVNVGAIGINDFIL